MKFTKQRLTRLADEGRKLFNLEGHFLKSAAILNLAALLGGIYLLIPSFRDGSFQWTDTEAIALIALSVLLLINYMQFMVMMRIRHKWLELEKNSTYDSLTQAFNRQCFEEILQEEITRSSRYHYPLSICLIDLDNFKKFNDTFGHVRADELLQKFSRLVKSSIRSVDCFARYGGDEFCVLLPHTDLVRSEKFLSRILVQVQEMLECTFSAGVTAYRSGETKTEFLMRADLALYQAKRDGKNRIRCVIGKDNSPVVVSF